MKSLFDRSPNRKAILSPLAAGGAWRSAIGSRLEALPPAAAPIAVTLGGGIALLVALGLFVGGSEPQPDLASLATTQEFPAQPGQPKLAASATAPDAIPVDAGDTAASAPVAIAPAIAGGLLDDDLAGRAPQRLVPPPAANELTAAIPPALPGASGMMPAAAAVPVAETEQELLALEERQREEVEADVGPPSDEWTAAIDTSPVGPMQSAITTKYVNLRVGPDDDADVLMVVPALAEIEAEAGCNWCAVTYDGRSGYMYKTFISYE